MAHAKSTGIVLIVSSDTDARARWRAALADRHSVHEGADVESMHRALRAVTVDVVLLDQALFEPAASRNGGIIPEQSSVARVVVMEDKDRDHDPIAALRAGVSGYCDRNASPELLGKAVDAVLRGEAWIPRRLIPQLIDELASQGSGEPSLTAQQRAGLDSLTPRELEVARMVYQAANNKTIARTLNISERTVKAHLSTIFRKLGIENRLHLALFFKQVP